MRTDHRNLLFASNPMIAQWYMALSEFSFTLEFIPGVENNIADAMSRLCRDKMVDEATEYTEELILSALSMSNKSNKIQYSKISKLNVHLDVSIDAGRTMLTLAAGG